MASSNRSLLLIAGAAVAAFLVMGKKKSAAKADAEADAYVTTKEWEEIQNLLLFLGYSAPVTGIKDPATSAALIKFQVDNNLPVTGNYDSETAGLATELLVITVQSWFPSAEEIAAIKAEQGIITMTMIEDIIARLKAEGKIPPDFGN